MVGSMASPPLLPAATFPPLAWFHLALRDGSRVCIHENFVKQSLRNRIHLVDSCGAMHVSLPVSKPNRLHRDTRNTHFSDKVHPSLLLKVLQTNCGKAPYYEHYLPDITEWAHKWLQPGQSMTEAALSSTRWVCSSLDWDHPETTIRYADGTNWDDWRPKARWKTIKTPRYPQVFEDRLGFVSGRSILDVLLHVGPETRDLPSCHGNDSPA